MVLVSSIGADAGTARSKGVNEGICASIQAPYLARQPINALHRLRPSQRLTDCGNVFSSVLDSAGAYGRHCVWSCHLRQREKRGVPLLGGALKLYRPPNVA